MPVITEDLNNFHAPCIIRTVYFVVIKEKKSADETGFTIRAAQG